MMREQITVEGCLQYVRPFVPKTAIPAEARTESVGG